MITKIYYFTGTGNSLKVARDLAQELGNAEVIPIVKVLDKELNLSTDRIGVVFPCHMMGVPVIAVKFLKKLKTDNYVFVVVVNGGGMYGTAIRARNILKKTGTILAAGFGIKMPSNYTPMGGALLKKEQDVLFWREKARVKEIAQIIRDGKLNIFEKGPVLLNIIMTGIVNRIFTPLIPFIAKKSFWADENCRGCDICVRVCPVGNIKLVNGKPVWGNKCTMCFACLHWCLKHAIQFGKKTQNKKRYHNPDINLDDVILRK